MSDGIVTPANPRDPMPRFDLKRYGGSAQWHAALAPWVIRQLDQIRGKHSFLAGVFDTVAFHAKKENIPSEQVSQTGNFEEPMYLRQIRQAFVMHNPGDMFELTFKEMEDLLDWAEAVRMSANRDDEPQSVSEEQLQIVFREIENRIDELNQEHRKVCFPTWTGAGTEVDATAQNSLAALMRELQSLLNRLRATLGETK